MKNADEARRRLERYVPDPRMLRLPDAAWGGGRRDIRHYSEAFARLLAAFPPGASPRLLELGCRNGLFLDFLAEQGYRGAVGVDQDPACAKVASALDLDVRVGDAAALSALFAPESFDAVLAVQFFHAELDLPGERRAAWMLAVLREARRCLKPGGMFYCDAEIVLPLKPIAALGFRIRSRSLRTKLFPGPKKTVRDDFWGFEKTPRP